MEPMKVYVVKAPFEHEGLAYAEGEKYELADSVVATLPEGSVEVYVEPETPAEDDTKPEVKPATPWVGNHTMKD